MFTRDQSILFKHRVLIDFTPQCFENRCLWQNGARCSSRLDLALPIHILQGSISSRRSMQSSPMAADSAHSGLCLLGFWTNWTGHNIPVRSLCLSSLTTNVPYRISSAWFLINKVRSQHSDRFWTLALALLPSFSLLESLGAYPESCVCWYIAPSACALSPRGLERSLSFTAFTLICVPGLLDQLSNPLYFRNPLSALITSWFLALDLEKGPGSGRFYGTLQLIASTLDSPHSQRACTHTHLVLSLPRTSSTLGTSGHHARVMVTSAVFTWPQTLLDVRSKHFGSRFLSEFKSVIPFLCRQNRRSHQSLSL